MQRLEGRLLLSATDLVAFLVCEHLSALDLAMAEGAGGGSAARDEAGELAARKGIEHERRYLESLTKEQAQVITIAEPRGGADGLRHAVAETASAMHQGAQFIYQGALAEEGWRGFADFLERVPRPSPILGAWSYEVADTKLARRAKPEYVIQLCLYSDLLAGIQGVHPASFHLLLGGGERRSFRLDEFAAFYRRLRARYGSRLAERFADTYPEPVAHCGLCRWHERCLETWEQDDHLTLIAGLGRAQAVRLAEGGIGTCAQLATATPTERPSRIGRAAFERLTAQARLQTHERATGEQIYELLPPEELRGFARLPEPRPGDLYFDMEGDPFYEDEGLEYLFGVTKLQDGDLAFRAFWGCDRAGEKRAFEAFIDTVIAALEVDPGIHVYHYAPYEPSALKRLMGRHGTREAELDRLLRGKVLVDLYAVTIQALRTSKPGYSIKQIEAFYMPTREEEVTDAGDSIIRFEEWLETGEQELLDSIEAYNEADCLSTAELHRWLLARREEAQQQFATRIPWRPAPEATPQSPDAAGALDEAARLASALTAGLSEDPLELTPPNRARWLLAQLLHYHRREEKPAWWAYFSRLEMSPDELVEDSEPIGQLTPRPQTPPAVDKRSLIYTLQFPEQEHKLAPGAALDPDTERGVDIVELNDAQGTLRIRRGKNRQSEPLPSALIPGKPYNTSEQRAALRRLATAMIGHREEFIAPQAILERQPPRVRDLQPGSPLLGSGDQTAQLELVIRGLENSYLFIQGPPGSGKTWTGGQLVVSLIASGARVGVAANSHKAIHNLLHEIEKTATERGVRFQGWKKCSSDNPESQFSSQLKAPLITNEPDAGAFPPPPDVQLAAGTAWLFSPEAMDATLDYLFIDEAGQVSLADALAMATTASNLILLGDPLQLAQVTQGTHPTGAGCSVLEHLLGNHDTVPPDRGIFIEHTRRMHPNVCAFISQSFYEHRLESISACSNQNLQAHGPLSGTGLRFIPTEHDGNTSSSPEEAGAIDTSIRQLRGSTITLHDKSKRQLQLADIMVVTPYNAQVRLLTERLPAGIRIGTVDKFQGQEAQIVFFSMATSSSAEVPRNVEFLYSRNRLNVAVSRARCLAVLVCSPKLLDLEPQTIEQMRLVNALCTLVELAP